MPEFIDLDDDLASFDHPDDAPLVDNEDIPVPVDLGGAERLLRQRRRLLAEIAEYEATVAREQERLEAYLDDRTAGKRRQIERLDASLEVFARARLADSGVKSAKLPDGSWQLREPGAPSLVVTDSSAALLARVPSRETVAVDKESAKKALAPGDWRPDPERPGVLVASAFWKDGGEMVDGVHFEKPAAETFKVGP